MSTPAILVQRLSAAVIVSAVLLTSSRAQIKTDIIEKYRAELERQATDPAMKRERGTQPQDWIFSLPAGVTSRQVTFYVDSTPCYARIFFPRDFDPRAKRPAVVVGHGINAQAVGIEKYAARFAERGLVAMAIDYRTYGYSGGDVLLIEPDRTTDERAVWERLARIRIKRTNLNNFRETEDFRAAISYLQGEPGVDPERIGIWGSSNGASVVLMVAALDARVKAVVAQAGAAGGLNASGPAPISPQMIEDGIRRARTRQGAEVDGGFSFRSKIDMWSSQVNREFRAGSMLGRIPETTKILWIPAEKDELLPPRGPSGPYAASKAFKGLSQVAEIPYITHFQIYSYAGFEVSSNLAADWFLKYLGESETGSARAEIPPARALLPDPRHDLRQGLRQGLRASAARALAAGVAAKEVRFYSEGIECYGKIFTPTGGSAGSDTEGRPAVVVAPGWGETAGAVEDYAAYFAARGLVAMVLDYRGWGRSGGFPEIVDAVRTDDRLRFSELTARVRIRRKRLLPQQQILDIRNALYYLQGEPGVDRARVGVWGAGMAGAHALVIAATDARIKAAVAERPVMAGRGRPKTAFALTGELLRFEQKQARANQIAPALAADLETRIALGEYQPFWYVEQIPQKTAVLFVTAGKEEAKAGEIDAEAAARLLKGPSDIVRLAVPATGSFEAAARAAVEWFLKHL